MKRQNHPHTHTKGERETQMRREYIDRSFFLVSSNSKSSSVTNRKRTLDALITFKIFTCIIRIFRVSRTTHNDTETVFESIKLKNKQTCYFFKRS